MTPKLLQKMVWSGANLSSYEEAAEAMEQLAEQSISARRIRRQVQAVGEARLQEREAQVASLEATPLPARRQAPEQTGAAAEAPSAAVVMMDGGRYQRRDHFGQAGATEEISGHKHWRESKVGCLLSMDSDTHTSDPQPQIPESFFQASAVREIAKIAEQQESQDAARQENDETEHLEAALGGGDYQPPELLWREVVASGQTYDQFGWRLEARARQLNFPSAARQAFVADGARANWRIQRKHFPQATPIADLIHALSYAWSAAQAVGEEALYARWAQAIWRGEVRRVIAELAQRQSELGQPPPGASPSDPRQRVHRAWTYFTNNGEHMNYSLYRRRGLPLTSSHIESTVKLINRRIKGSEKFWRAPTSECVLQLRADYLSDSKPLTSFWTRWQANQSGSNHYHTTT